MISHWHVSRWMRKLGICKCRMQQERKNTQQHWTEVDLSSKLLTSIDIEIENRKESALTANWIVMRAADAPGGRHVSEFMQNSSTVTYWRLTMTMADITCSAWDTASFDDDECSCCSLTIHKLVVLCFFPDIKTDSSVTTTSNAISCIKNVFLCHFSLHISRYGCLCKRAMKFDRLWTHWRFRTNARARWTASQFVLVNQKVCLAVHTFYFFWYYSLTNFGMWYTTGKEKFSIRWTKWNDNNVTQ